MLTGYPCNDVGCAGQYKVNRLEKGDAAHCNACLAPISLRTLLVRHAQDRVHTEHPIESLRMTPEPCKHCEHTTADKAQLTLLEERIRKALQAYTLIGSYELRAMHMVRTLQGLV